MSTSKISLSDLFLDKDLKIRLIPVIICLLLSSVAGFATPIIIKNVFESYDNKSVYELNLIYLALILVFSYVNRVLYGISVNLYVKHVVHNIREVCYRSWLFSLDTIEDSKKNKKSDFPLGEVLARIMGDTDAIRELVTTGTFGLFIDLMTIAAAIVSFFQIHFKAGIVLTITEVTACIALVFLSRRMMSIFLTVRKSIGLLSRKMANVIEGLPETYFNQHGNYTSKTTRIYLNDFLKKQLHANFWDASYYSLADSLLPIFLLIFMQTITWTQISTAAMVAVIFELLQRSIGPIKDFAGKMANIQRAMAGVKRINEFQSHLGELPQVSGGEQEKINLKNFHVNLESFTYASKNEDGEKFSLQNITFDAKKGEMVGLVGPSGSGKSTLLGILAGEITPKNPTVIIEDINGEKIRYPENNQYEKYYGQVSVVSQDSHIFSESLANNITLGADATGLESFWKEVCTNIPYLARWGVNLETKIIPGELSLGQKQLVAALRSCFLKRPIVLFDEIASGLDSELELALRKLIIIIGEHSLTFIVAHRLETIVKSDKILVMESGKLVASGTHDALLSSSVLYQDLIQEIRATS